MHWVLSSDSAGDAVLQKAVAALSTPANLAKFNTAQVKTSSSFKIRYPDTTEQDEELCVAQCLHSEAAIFQPQLSPGACTARYVSGAV